MKFSRKLKPKQMLNASVGSSASISCINYKLSAAYVHDALQGRYYNAGLGKNLEQGKRTSVWCVYITSHFIYTAMILLVVGFHCTISLYEPVQMIATAHLHLHPLSLWGGISCCIFYLVDILLVLFSCRPHQYFAFNHGRLYVLLAFLVATDYILCASAGRMVFRFLRPFLLIFRIPALRSTGLVMMGVTPKFLQFLLILGAYVTVFAVIGVHLFMDVYFDSEVVEGQHDGIYEGAFNHTGIAILEIFVLMTGGSYPRFMIPAYDKYGPIVLSYFATIIMTGEIILYGILVARIYDFYVKANKSHVKEERHHERQCLIRAFEIMDQESTGSISFHQWKSLMKCLRPNASSAEVRKRFRKMKDLAKHEQDDNCDSAREIESNQSLNVYEFFYLTNVLQFTVEKAKPKKSFQDYRISKNSFRLFLSWLKRKIFWVCYAWCNTRFAYYVSLTLNIVFVAPFAVMWYGITPTASRITYSIEVILISLITLETIVQFIALGISYMIQEMLLQFSSVLVAIACLIYVRLTNLSNWNSGWVPVVAYLCMILRLSGFKRKSSSMFHWFRRMAPPLFTLLCLTFIAFYTYGIIGMECFGSLHSEVNLPEGISLCKYGFESLGCSLLTLYQISLGSSWHKVMHFIMEQVDPWTCLYFVFFYTLMQMLVLNIISAIMVELSNAIYNDENEAKQRDKEYETREETNVASRTEDMHIGLVPGVYSKKISSVSNTTVIAALSMTTDLFSRDNQLFPHRKSSEKTLPQKINSLSDTSPTLKQVNLPCIVEEDLTIEDIDDVTLTGRKELGKWTRDIVPDMTFLNADDLRRLYAEMGQSIARLKLNTTRKRQSSQSNDHGISEMKN